MKSSEKQRKNKTLIYLSSLKREVQISLLLLPEQYHTLLIIDYISKLGINSKVNSVTELSKIFFIVNLASKSKYKKEHSEIQVIRDFFFPKAKTNFTLFFFYIFLYNDLYQKIKKIVYKI